MPFGGQTTLDRYVPVPPAQVFKALLRATNNRFKVKKSDDFAMTVDFSSGASAFTWGENFSAQVVPSEGGATIKVSGVGKVGGQLMQQSRNSKLMNQLFDDVVQLVRP